MNAKGISLVALVVGATLVLCSPRDEELNRDSTRERCATAMWNADAKTLRELKCEARFAHHTSFALVEEKLFDEQDEGEGEDVAITEEEWNQAEKEILQENMLQDERQFPRELNWKHKEL